MKMKLSEIVLGKHQGKDIYQFILENNKGMIVKIMNYGATITSIQVPGDNAKLVSIACGFDKLEGYLSDEYRRNAPYFGCTVGRYCSQIKNSRFSLDGKTYELAKNCGENNLHGGLTGFDKKVWSAKTVESEEEICVTFSLFSEDMEEGFPGNVEASVRIKLNNNNEITIDYRANTDKTTPLSMTNHTYFNLNGFTNDITGHEVFVFSGKRLELDDSGAATGEIVDLTNAADDLRNGKIIEDVHKEMGTGFEHFYVIKDDCTELQHAATVKDPGSGRKLEVETTEPCLLFYSGKYTSDELKRENEDKYGKYRGFCCETHRFPNGPNIPGSPGSFTKQGELFVSQTIFRIYP
jgi:aldose 1-epimerase